MTASKRFKPSTIIPGDLYVERGADRQLDRIIEDMGRPGYVLVARQMGKTNLLINMKRRRAKAGDVVVYLDLSNRTPDVRTFFWGIIDALIETLMPLKEIDRTRIDADREKRATVPSVEFDRHLRSVLKSVPGKKVIIVLDEIDSLINTSYSDTVLAQVRSMYFARVNHEEYENLTYVLSGVAEPIDLIKDKTISPFNIGEKIYLGDFTEEEFSALLNKSGVDISVGVARRVFHWTQGNPRQSWDILSAVEDKILAGEPVGNDLVDEIVRNLYLVSFDRAPIDHVRALAESDPLVREGIVTLRYGKGDALSERALSRLYLAGITNGIANPAIKNPIIDAALSQDWLSKLAQVQTSILDAAGRRFELNEYAEALELYNEYVSAAGSDSEMPVISKAQYGISMYEVGDFSSAHETLKEVFDVSKKATGALLAPFIGGALLRIGEPKQAIEFLESIGTVDDEERQLSCDVTLSSAYLLADPVANSSKVVALLEKTLGGPSSAAGANMPEGPWLSARFNLARGKLLQGNEKGALEQIKQALSEASSLYRPALLLAAIKLSKSRGDQREYLMQGAGTILDERLRPRSGPALGLEFSRAHVAPIMSELIRFQEFRLFDDLLTYSAEFNQAPEVPLERVLWLASASSNSSITPNVKALLTYAANELYTDDLPVHVKLQVLRDAAAANAPLTTTPLHRRYLAEFRSAGWDSSFSDDQILAALSFVIDEVSAGHIDFALDFLIYFVKSIDNIESINPLLGVIALQQLVLVQDRLGLINESEISARQLLEFIDKMDGLEPEYRSMVSNQRTYAQKILADRELAKLTRPTTPRMIPIELRGIGRNEYVVVRFIDSPLELIRKYKMVDRDIQEGKLEFVRRAEDVGQRR